MIRIAVTPEARKLMEPKFDDLKLISMDGWTDASPFPRKYTKHSFVSGDPDSQAIRVRYFKKDGAFAGRAWFGPHCEGPPAHAHGGSQAALLDEGMGAVAWASGYSVVAAKIEINFRAPLPIGSVLTMWCEIEKVDGRKIYSKARLEDDQGLVFSEGAGLFVVVDTKEKFKSGS